MFVMIFSFYVNAVMAKTPFSYFSLTLPSLSLSLSLSLSQMIVCLSVVGMWRADGNPNSCTDLDEI